ncbi:MAG: 3-oxoacyl-ACP synthase [Bacteroidetes bacterium]|nr:3-oxoacyl-ACP synthase [Bacteroidota bacterium]
MKQTLYNLCLAHITATIKNAEELIADAREAAANETKSSAGDKYETAREMMQQEIDLNTTRLQAAKAQEQVLKQIDTEKTNDVVVPGSVVQTNSGYFYIAVGAGQLMVDGVKYYAISMDSPLGAQLKGKRAGDTYALNGRTFTIISVN